MLEIFITEGKDDGLLEESPDAEVSCSARASPPSISSEASGNEAVEEAAVDILADAGMEMRLKVGFSLAYQVASCERYVFETDDPQLILLDRLYTSSYSKGDLGVLPFCAICLQKALRICCLEDSTVDEVDGRFVKAPKL